MKIPCLAVLSCFLASALPARAQVVTAPRCGSSFSRNLYRVCVPDGGTAWAVDEPNNSRFTNRDAVEVEVRHFNFLRYTLAFDVKEETSQAYQYLTKLWTSILDPSLMTALLALGGTIDKNEETVFLDTLRDEYRRALALDQKITTVASQYKRTGLTPTEAATLKAAVLGPGTPACDPAATDAINKPDFPRPQPGTPPPGDPLLACTVSEIARGLNLANARLQQIVLTDNGAFVDAMSGARRRLYTTVTEAYTNIRKRSDLFVSLTEKTVGVETKKAGKHNAGTRVTLTLTAVDEGGAKSPVADVNYFVETTMPLVFHGGLAFSGLQDVNFDKIKRATAFGEEEVFQKTSDSDSSTGFSAFLSWTLLQFSRNAGPNNSKAALLVSLGTDITEPGKRIYAGPSILLFNRMALTAGVAFGKVAEGVTQTLDPNVFRVIKEEPKGSFFFSLTSKVP